MRPLSVFPFARIGTFVLSPCSRSGARTCSSIRTGRGFSTVSKPKARNQNGGPFRDCVLPAALEKIRKRFKNFDDDYRKIRTVVGCPSTEGITAVEAAGKEPMRVLASVMPTFGRCGVTRIPQLQTPDARRLTHELVANLKHDDAL